MFTFMTGISANGRRASPDARIQDDLHNGLMIGQCGLDPLVTDVAARLTGFP
jgi:hypothetical protein